MAAEGASHGDDGTAEPDRGDAAPPALEPIAWLALVARWTELARASRAIPPEASRLRDSVPHLIAIEATTAALGELARVPEADRAHARTIAEISVRNAAGELDRLWRGEEWPDEFIEACEAAERALRNAVYAGLEALVVDDAPGATADPAAMDAVEVPELDLGFDPDDPSTHRGTLACMPPGSLAMPGEPVCWWCGRKAPSLRAGHDTLPLVRRGIALPLQVYRGLDERGRFTSDTLAPVTEDLLPGLPMLVPILLDGVRIGGFLHPREAWSRMQRAALEGRGRLAVVRFEA